MTTYYVPTRTLIDYGSDNVDRSSYTTGSITPVANKLYLMLVVNTKASPVTNPTATHAGGLTWVAVDGATTGGIRVKMFRGMKSSGLSAGTSTIDFGGTTQTSCAWAVYEMDLVDTSGTDGSGAVVDHNAATATSVTSVSTTMAGTAGEATVGGGIINNSGLSPVAGSGFTFDRADTYTNPSTTYLIEYQAADDSTVDYSWTGTATGGVVGARIHGAAFTGHVLRVGMGTLDGLAGVGQGRFNPTLE